jgi:negative regulator of sigma E activity
MKDKLHEQLSALVDDELAGHEQALLLKQLAADTAFAGAAVTLPACQRCPA